MITANVAGSSGSSALRDRCADRRKSSSPNSLSSSDLHEMEAELNEHANKKHDDDGCDTRTDEERKADEEKVNQLRKMISERRRKRFCRDYKNIAYLACVASVILAAIVLIVLAATGVISANA